MNFPKLARWKVHDNEIYNKIRKIETEEEKQHIIQLGQQVEDAVGEYLRLTDGRQMVNLIPDFREEMVVSDEQSDDDERIDTRVEQYTSRAMLCQKTLDAITQQVPILYQPSFQVGDCFVRADFMVLQPNGQYRLIEVKAKSGVRKTVKDDGDNKRIGQLEDTFIHDLSFQKYVINQSLQQHGFSFLESVRMAYLNKEYVKQGPLDYGQLIVVDQMDVISSLVVVQRKKETTLERNDVLLSDQKIRGIVKVMQEQLPLEQIAFKKLHPFL